MAEDQLVLPIIDSHVHLWPGSEASTHTWYDESSPSHPLAGQRSVAEYRRAARSAPSLLGFVAVEADRRTDLETGAADGSGWRHALDEVRWMRRVALGKPRSSNDKGNGEDKGDGGKDNSDGDDEGLTADDAKLCLGIVPWAPLPSGPEVLERYLGLVREAAGDEVWPKVKGFRYLLQDKPHGTMLQQPFIDGLKLLGRRGFVFEVGVDQHKRGKRQLDELVEMVDRAHDGVPEEEKVTLILNHLCKPDLTIYNVTSDPSFTAWRTAMYTLSKASNTYVKLSGGLSEMPASLRAQPAAHIFQSTLAWLGIVLATFGPARIMYGSDWPVCTTAVASGSSEDDEDDNAWTKWRDVVEKMCWMATLGDDERAMIFGGTAKKAYRL